MPATTLIHDPEALRTARFRAGYNLTQAAAKIGTSPGYLHDLESGRASFRRCPSRMVKLAKLYRVPLAELEAKDAAA